MLPIAKFDPVKDDEENESSLRLGADLPRRIHLVGIAGAGLSGAARVLSLLGHRVSGFDRVTSPFLEELSSLGVGFTVGDDARPRLDEEVELLVRSAAVPLTDSDCARALELGIPVWKYSRLLGHLCPAGRTLAVAGTHGKTSISWMLTYALEGIGRALGATAPQNGFLIGGLDTQRKVNAHPPGEGGWFAVEACEYDRSFLQIPPTGAVIANVEADHLDYYGDLAAVEEAFARFADRVHPDGLLVVGDQVPERVTSAARVRHWRLGRELRVELCGERDGRFDFRLFGPGWATPVVQLAVPGRFQVTNAALAIALAVGCAAHEWRLDPSVAACEAALALMDFSGAARRFETWGVENGVEVVHDYAHHPTEVRVTLETARRALRESNSLHVLFQPHQYSRTARFLGEFVESLRGADRVVVADIYGARASTDHRGEGVDELVTRLALAGVDAVAGGNLYSSLEQTVLGLPEECALLVLGAGDVETIRDDLLFALAVRSPGTRRAVR